MPLRGITAVCKEMFTFRSQLQMAKSCFCLCLNSALDFHSLCFPCCIWLSACCLCSPNVCRCAPVAPLSLRLLTEPLLLRAWPQQPLQSAAVQDCSKGLSKDPLPSQSRIPAGRAPTRHHKHWHGSGLCPCSPRAHPREARGAHSRHSQAGSDQERDFHPQERRLRGFLELIAH